MAGQRKGANLPAGDASPSAIPARSDRSIPEGEADVIGGPRADAKGRAALSELTRVRLASQLRAMYDNVAKQPVPDRFAELIARLDGETRKMS